MTFKRPVWWGVLLGLVLVAGLNYFAFEYYLYWRWWWFDLIVHLIAGATVATAVLSFYFDIHKVYPKFLIVMLIAVGFSFLIGGLWELFEFGAYKIWPGYPVFKTLETLQVGWLDTVTDLFMDTVGGLVAGLAFWYTPFNIYKQPAKNEKH
jgi:hypothetical protein